MRTAAAHGNFNLGSLIDYRSFKIRFFFFNATIFNPLDNFFSWAGKVC